MKYKNIDRVRTLCSQMKDIEEKIDDLQKLKTTGTIVIRGTQINVEVFSGQDMADWVVSRAILKYKGRLLELNAELEKL